MTVTYALTTRTPSRSSYTTSMDSTAGRGRFTLPRCYVRIPRLWPAQPSPARLEPQGHADSSPLPPDQPPPVTNVTAGYT